MSEHKRSSSIRTKLLSSYMIVFIVFIITISMVIFTSYKSLLIQNIAETRVDVLRQIAERTKAIKNSVVTISNLYLLNPTIYELLENENPITIQQISLLDEEDDLTSTQRASILELDAFKKDYDKIFKDINIEYDVVLIGKNGFDYATSHPDTYNFRKLEQQLFFHSIKENKNGISFISSFKDFRFPMDDRYVFSASRNVYDSNGEFLGVLMVMVDESFLYETYQNSVHGHNTIYIVDDSGNVVTHSISSFRGMNFINIENFRKLYTTNSSRVVSKARDEFLISNYYDDESNWTIIEEYRTEALFKQVNSALYTMIQIVMFGVAIALAVSIYISNKVSRPIKELSDDMSKVKDGDLSIITSASGFNEVEELSIGFNQMVVEIKELLVDVQIKEEEKRRLDLDFLRAQIKPHFLYNTLFSIKCLVEVGKNDEASQMMQAFINLLKLTLRADTDFIRLDQEIEAIQLYIDLRKFGDLHGVEFEVEMREETADCKVPPLIIQPIVENAIFHGLHDRYQSETITIISQIEENQLLISITDDGIGMSDEEVQKLLESFKTIDIKMNKSIGLSNVDRRICTHFGEAYGVRIESEMGIGTTITLVLPIIKKEDGDNR